eukprot:5380188-Prymnesium_polylepis.1
MSPGRMPQLPIPISIAVLIEYQLIEAQSVIAHNQLGVVKLLQHRLHAALAVDPEGRLFCLGKRLFLPALQNQVPENYEILHRVGCAW